jgi:hypothetical protein
LGFPVDCRAHGRADVIAIASEQLRHAFDNGTFAAAAGGWKLAKETAGAERGTV